MCFAEKGRVIARRRQRTGKSFFANIRVRIDPIVMHPMGTAELTGQNRRPRRLAGDARGDVSVKPRATGRKLVEMRRFDLAPFKAKTIGAVPVGGNRKNWVGPCGCSQFSPKGRYDNQDGQEGESDGDWA